MMDFFARPIGIAQPSTQPGRRQTAGLASRWVAHPSFRVLRLRRDAGGYGTMSEIRTVATGLRFPEGPVAMRDGSVVLVEIERQTVTRVRPDGSTDVIAH